MPAALAPSVDTSSRVGVWGRVEQAVDILDTSSKVTLEERRAADGLDAYVPRILRGSELYDADVDRFFLDLPLNGVRSSHSLRAYGYDIMVWLRFLTEVCDKTVWEAARADVEAFHRIRRRSGPGSGYRRRRGTDRLLQ